MVRLAVEIEGAPSPIVGFDRAVPDPSHASFPRSSTYDASWLLSLDMGPNPRWLLEDLLVDADVAGGTRVLGLGCGRGAPSVFLAREHGAEVWATDLWIPADETFALVSARKR